jgi:hypothetical protein
MSKRTLFIDNHEDEEASIFNDFGVTLKTVPMLYI